MTTSNIVIKLKITRIKTFLTQSDNIFSDYTECFFCNSKNLGDVIKYEYIRDNTYTKKIRQIYNLSISSINSNLILNECINCESFTFSRWYSSSVQKEIYKKTNHKLGWSKFFNTIFKNYPDIILKDIEIYSKLKKQINKIDSYMEIKCPFMGMYPLFSLIEQKDGNEKLFKSNLNIIKYFFLKLRKKNLNKEIIEKKNKIKLPDNCIFLSDYSDSGWGDECKTYDCNCKDIANQFHWINSSNIESFVSSKEKVDLLFMNNTLDHIGNPLATLTKISKNVRNMYIKFHDLKGGSHHSFFLTENTFRVIARKLNFKIIYIDKNELLLIKQF